MAPILSGVTVSNDGLTLTLENAEAHCIRPSGKKPGELKVFATGSGIKSRLTTASEILSMDATELEAKTIKHYLHPSVAEAAKTLFELLPPPPVVVRDPKKDVEIIPGDLETLERKATIRGTLRGTRADVIITDDIEESYVQRMDIGSSKDTRQVDGNLSTNTKPRKETTEPMNTTKELTLTTNPFDFEGMDVRVLTHNETGEPWFVARDTCDCLGIQNAPQAVRDLDRDEKVDIHITSLKSDSGHLRKTKAISKPGLYRIVMKSRKPVAKRFQRWLAHEVLPALDSKGVYMMPNVAKPSVPDFSDPIAMARAWADAKEAEQKAADKAMMLAEKLDTVTDQVIEMKPKAESHDRFLSSEATTSLSHVAKSLGIGPMKLTAFLRAEGIIFRREEDEEGKPKKNAVNEPYQPYIDKGFFELVQVPYESNGRTKHNSQTRVTPSGLDFIKELVDAAGSERFMSLAAAAKAVA